MILFPRLSTQFSVLHEYLRASSCNFSQGHFQWTSLYSDSILRFVWAGFYLYIQIIIFWLSCTRFKKNLSACILITHCDISHILNHCYLLSHIILNLCHNGGVYTSQWIRKCVKCQKFCKVPLKQCVHYIGCPWDHWGIYSNWNFSKYVSGHN